MSGHCIKVKKSSVRMCGARNVQFEPCAVYPVQVPLKSCSIEQRDVIARLTASAGSRFCVYLSFM